MNNIPNIIYLNTGGDEEEDFEKLFGVTWSDCPIDGSFDIRYIRDDPSVKIESPLIKLAQMAKSLTEQQKEAHEKQKNIDWEWAENLWFEWLKKWLIE